MTKTHNDLLREWGDGVGIPVSLARRRYDEFTDNRCPSCRGLLSLPVCDSFPRRLRMLRERIIDEYGVMQCPECEENIDTFQAVEVVEPGEVSSELDAERPPDPPETRIKEEVVPCGCLLEERKYIAIIDTNALAADC